MKAASVLLLHDAVHPLVYLLLEAELCCCLRCYRSWTYLSREALRGAIHLVHLEKVMLEASSRRMQYKETVVLLSLFFLGEVPFQ